MIVIEPDTKPLFDKDGEGLYVLPLFRAMVMMAQDYGIQPYHPIVTSTGGKIVTVVDSHYMATFRPIHRDVWVDCLVEIWTVNRHSSALPGLHEPITYVDNHGGWVGTKSVAKFIVH